MPNEAIRNRQLGISFVQFSTFNYIYAEMVLQSFAVKFSDDLFFYSFSLAVFVDGGFQQHRKKRAPYVTKGVATSLWQICLELQINILYDIET